MMRAQWVMANWKMNGSTASIHALLDQLLQGLSPEAAAHCVLFPPAIYLPLVQTRLSGHGLQWGGQNVYTQTAGAYTGEHACSMLAEFGCHYVLVGHSERRQLFHEDVKFVADKFHQVKEHGMIPVLCVGETLEEREAGLTQVVLARQLAAVLRNPATDFTQCVIAYEPVWAIGTGQTASPDEAQAVHAFIRGWVSEQSTASASALSILYGGSVNASNARALFSMPDIDGGLVGGASLDAGQFLEIVKCIN
jgi:triosephosphate isomerase